MISEKDVKS